MDITPNVGIGAVRFGMNPAEVVALFPEAQMYEDWMGGNLNGSLLYQGIILGFDKYDGVGPLLNSRLVEIRMFGRKDAVLWGQPVDTWTKEAIAEYSDQHKIAYKYQPNGDVLVDATLSLSFDEQGRAEYVEMWTNVQDKPAQTGGAIQR